VDPSVAEDVLAPYAHYGESCLSSSSGSGGDAFPPEVEMKDAVDVLEEETIKPGANLYFSELDGERARRLHEMARSGGGHVHESDGMKLHESEICQTTGSNMDTKGDGDELKEYPKLILFEGLRDLISLKKRSDDFPLPRNIMDQMKQESSMAMVLWKPQQQIGPLALKAGSQMQAPCEASTCARTTARYTFNCPSSKQSKPHSSDKDEEDKEDMDLSV
jgi:hypothetical protein